MHKSREGREKAPWISLSIGRTLRVQGEYARAIQYLNQARDSFEAIDNTYGLACTLEELAFCSGELSRNAAALEYAHLAISKYQQLGRTMELAWAYDNISYIYFYRYRYKEALSYSLKARAIFLEQGSNQGLSWNACNLARIHLEMSNPYKALYFYKEADKAFAALGNQQGKALCTMGLGTVYRGICEFAKARKQFEKARALYTLFKIKDHIGWCLINEAAIDRLEGLPIAAATKNKKALQVFSSIRKQDGIAWTHFQIGQLLRDQGLPLKSWQTLREAINLHKDIGSGKGVGWGENEWGLTYLELGDLPRARESFLTAKAAAEEMSIDPLYIEALKNLATVSMEAGQLNAAGKFLHQAISTGEKLQTWEVLGAAYLVGARLAFMQGDINKSKGHLQLAGKVIAEYDLARLEPLQMVMMGEIQLYQGKTTQAAKTWTDTIKVADRMLQKEIRVRAQLGLVQIKADRMSTGEISRRLYQIEKDCRALSSRKLKAKSLAVRAWLAQRRNKHFDQKLMAQALQVAESSGHVVLQKNLLSVFCWMSEVQKISQELSLYAALLRRLLQTGPGDLGLVRFDRKVFDRLPVSLIL